MDKENSPSAGEEPSTIVQEFLYLANAVYGVYLDASMALGNLASSYMEYQKAHIQRTEASGEQQAFEATNPIINYEAGPEGQQRPVHQTTLAAIIERNAPSGFHMQFLARMCVVALYQYWEDQFRPRLVEALGREVSHGTFGELRHLRRSIIHRGGRALPELTACKALPRFEQDKDIVLDHAAMDQILNAVKKAALGLVEPGAV